MQDAEAQQDQAQMLKPVSASVKASKPSGVSIKASVNRGRSSAVIRNGAAKRDLSKVSVAADAAVTAVPGAQPSNQQSAPETTDQAIDVEMDCGDVQASNSTEKSTAAPTNKRQKTAGKQTAPRKVTKAKAAAAKADEEADTAGSSSDDGSDDENDGTAAAAAAAADAACFSAEEVTQVNTALLTWYDRVMRILPWRRNPHHKPDTQQQQQEKQDTQMPVPGAAAAAGSGGAAAGNSSSGGAKTKQKKPTKAEVAAAEAAAVVAAAKPAPADLTPQQFAYRVWVSEIMLQQTQVARVIAYFNTWVSTWPTVQQLAKATQEQVNEVWAGLGYYRRARYLLEGAQYIVNKLDGQFPETAAGMRQIPGVGPYTAAAVASIAFNDPAAAVDGNVIRVLSRLRALRGNPSKMVKTWDRLAAELLHPDRPGCHNQAMMELGATVCKPVNPLCEACPVNTCCAAYKQVLDYAAAGGAPDVEDAPRVTDYPEKVAKASKHEQHVAVCVLKVLTLPGVTTAAELAAAAAAAAAAGSGASAKKSKTAAAAAAAGSSKQGNIRSFFKPAAKSPADKTPAAAAAGGSSGGDNGVQEQQGGQGVELSEADMLVAGGVAHYLLVQRPSTGLLAGLWEFPGVIVDCEPTPKIRRTAVDNYLSSSLGVQGLQVPVAAAAAAAGESGDGVRVLHRRQLGSAVHIFSHIRQTMHAEELVLLAPKLEDVCSTAAPAAAAAAADGGKQTEGLADADTAAAAAASKGAGANGKKQKAGAATAAAVTSGSNGSSSDSSSRPQMRWVSAADISKQGLTSGVRKVLQLSLK